MSISKDTFDSTTRRGTCAHCHKAIHYSANGSAWYHDDTRLRVCTVEPLFAEPTSTVATLEDELSDENREWLMGYGLPVRNLIGAFDKRGREIERLRSDLRDLLVDLRENHYSELKGCGLFCSLASREGIKL